MPRPGQPQQPQIKRGQGSDALPYGAATRANKAPKSRMSMPAPTDEQEFKPQSPDEQFAFAPTDFPNEPVTSGVPFGPGPSGRAPAGMEATLARVRRNLPLLQQLASEPDAPQQLRTIVGYLLSTES